MLLNNITVFDFETSGLDPECERVIEMAAIKIHKGIVVGEFNCFIQQDKPLDVKITELTGITDDDLKDGFKEDIAFRMLNQFMGSNIIVAHNATFDLGFLHHARMRLFQKSFDNPFLDTYTIARHRDVYPYKLVALCERYGIDMGTAHRALADVYGCYNLLQKQDEDSPVDEWINKLSYMNKYGPAKWYPAHAEVFGADNKYEPRRATV
jgi:DNA polymerase-3 subunit epsilon